jgi:Chaperone of endosialidase
MKNVKHTLLFTAATFLSFTAAAQVWNPTGTTLETLPAATRVGVNIVPLPQIQTQSNAAVGSIFSIVGQNTRNVSGLSVGIEGWVNNPNTVNLSDGIAVWGFSEHFGPGRAIGVRGYGKNFLDGKGTAFGVYGEAYISNCVPAIFGVPPSHVAVGLYGFAANTLSCVTPGKVWALYADGPSFTTTGAWTPSDERLKKDVKEIGSALSIINQLAPRSYLFNKEGDYRFTSLPEGKQLGFMAQDIEKVLPELVTEAPLYIHDQKDSKEPPRSETIKAINYTGLIPILTQAIKEQEAKIEALEARLKALETRKTNSEPAVVGTLWQNSPNPFNLSTVIRYDLPVAVRQASVLVFDMQGKQVKQFILAGRTNGNLVLQANELPAGMYMYTLLADGKEIDTKRMILTKD